MKFLSDEPRVRLVKSFTTPYQNIVATARTCYSSKGIIEDDQVGPPEKFAPLAKSIYEAGHHTTFQHAHFQFALENVSRQFLWSFLHSHPFYNSEQVSQRYVAVKPDTLLVPDLPTDQLAIYRDATEMLFDGYRRLCEMLLEPAEREFFKRFNRSERMAKKHRLAIKKKAQEAARYVLPLATHAYLYHTISGVTLLRYHRLSQQYDVPRETKFIVDQMIEALLSHDEYYNLTLQDPIPLEETPEAQFFEEHPEVLQGRYAEAFAEEFDEELGGYTSKLLSHPEHGERIIADAVREVLGLPRKMMSDEEAINRALDPASNGLLSEALNLTTMHKLGRALQHVHFTFKKKLSHTADSQDQRHRMTPGSRPVMAAHLFDKPDYITPELIAKDDQATAVYEETMTRLWEKVAQLRRLGASPETHTYVLPNAVSIRFTESADLLNLRHKHVMRLCYNAQEEIWKASVDEAQQIRDRLPLLGQFLLPPCGLRVRAKRKPICPEGPRYCGVRVWKLDLKDYERVI